MRPLVRPSACSRTRMRPTSHRASASVSTGSSARRRRERRGACVGTRGSAVGGLAGRDLELRLLEQVLGVAALVAMRGEVRQVVAGDVAGDVLAVEARRLEL